ncbi:hypothetical protein N9L20_02745 [Flavobacteriaceae bacterium]|nr:hypothetical protein [Flavobacteriaceae bacterium]
MNINELLDRLDEIFHPVSQESTEKKSDTPHPSSLIAKVGKLITTFVRTVIGAPILFMTSFVKNELIHAFKRDLKFFGLLSLVAILIVMALSIFWFTFSAYMALYMVEEQGLTWHQSLGWVMVWQLAAVGVLFLIAVWIYHSFKTSGLLKRLGETKIS